MEKYKGLDIGNLIKGRVEGIFRIVVRRFGMIVVVVGLEISFWDCRWGWRVVGEMCLGKNGVNR